MEEEQWRKSGKEKENGPSPPMIQGMDFIGQGNAGGLNVINGQYNLRSAHILSHFLLFVHEQNPWVMAIHRSPVEMKVKKIIRIFGQHCVAVTRSISEMFFVWDPGRSRTSWGADLVSRTA
jgi:hypothetical protein